MEYKDCNIVSTDTNTIIKNKIKIIMMSQTSNYSNNTLIRSNNSNHNHNKNNNN